MKDDEDADDDHRQLEDDVGEREHGQLALASPAGHVEDVEQAGGDDDQGGHPHLPAGRCEVGGDGLQIVRTEIAARAATIR